MSAVTDIAKGYIAGHGIRLILQVATYDTSVMIAERLQQNKDLLGKQFSFTVFNFNPSIIKTKNKFGWGSGIGQAQVKMFYKWNNERIIELQGVIYPNAFSILDSFLVKKLTKQKSIKEQIEDFEKIGEEGLMISVLEAGDNFCSAIGEYYIESFNYDKSLFSFNGNADKIEYTLVLEKIKPLAKTS